MNYLVAVMGDRITAEAAYVALEKADLPTAQLSIVGKGYKDLDDLPFRDPSDAGRARMKLMATWLIPFGFLGGVAFSLATELQTFAWAGNMGNHVLGGLMGAFGASMGSVFISGGPILALGKGDKQSYRDRIAAGQYLVIIQGNDGIIRRASPVIKQQNPELLQDIGDDSLAADY
jgi:hypothetical protein